MAPRRRDLLAVVGAGLLGSAAGCLDVLSGADGGDGTGTGGTTARTARSPPATTGADDGSGGSDGPPRRTDTGDRAPAASPFVRWVPPADAVGGIEGPRAGTVDHVSPAAVRAHRGAFSPATLSAFGSLLRRSQTLLDVGPLHLAERYGRSFGVGAGAVDTVVRFGDARVVLGEFGGRPVADALRADGYESAGEYRGFRVFASRSRSVAVRPGVVAVGGGEAAGPGVLRRVLDAGVGAGSRRASTDPDYARLVAEYDAPGVAVFRAFGEDADVSPSLGRFRGLAARGFGWEFGPELTALTVAFVFRSADAARPGPVREWARSVPGLDGYDYAVGADGRTVRLAGTVPTGEYDGLAVGTPPPPEDPTTATTGTGGPADGPAAVEWRFGVDYGAGALSVTHDGGPALPADRLTVTVGDETRRTRSVGADGDGRLEAGEALAVPVSVEDGGALVRVRYRPDDGGRTTLARYRLPAA